MEMYQVYQHKKADNGQIFYIGIGNKKRAYNKHGRNSIWNRIVNKHDYTVEIVSDNCSKEEAIQIEQYLIAYYGRIVLNTGCLANITDGGDGVNGYKVSEETRKKISQRNKGRKLSAEHKANMSKAAKGRKNCNRKLTDEQIIFIRENYSPKYKHQYSQANLAIMFNVSQPTIDNILRNKNYVS
jgi:hypothetical protein